MYIKCTFYVNSYNLQQEVVIFVCKQVFVQIYKSINLFSSISKNVISLGVFDGVHSGHCKIITCLNNIAKISKQISTLISFYPHPIDFFYPQKKIGYLTLYEERKFLLKKTGLNNLILQPFNQKIANMNFEFFIKNILIKQLNMKYLIVGYDNNIGKNKEGCYNKLKKLSIKYNFGINRINPLKINSKIISSTSIREALSEGNLSWANKALGYPYIISGIIIKGNQLGNKIGFPTANIKIDNKKFIPLNGVYAVKAKINYKIYNGMLNIGFRPTLGINKNIIIEVHLLNFNKMIYNHIIYIYLYKYIRKEKKFDTIYQLKKQLEKDKKYIQYIFSMNFFI